jgi:hypothetical protein
VSLALALLLCGAPEVLVDRVVVVVDKEVVTESELLTEARVFLVMHEGERGAKAAAASDLDPQFVETMRTLVINELLIAKQVRRVGYVDISEQEVEHAVRRFVQAFGTIDAYRAFARKFDLGESTLRDILRRELKHAKFVAPRLRPYAGQSENDDGQQRYNDALDRWLSELRANADIRLLGPNGELERQ